MNARRPVFEITRVNHHVVILKYALQIEALRIGLGQKNERTHSGFNRAVEC